MLWIDRWFYVAIAGVTIVAVGVGFSRTYAAPMASGTFQGPAILHVHGGLALCWVLLFLSQPLLVRFRRQALHRRLGRLGLPLAIGVAATMVPAGVYQATRDAAAGAGPTGISSLLGVVRPQFRLRIEEIRVFYDVVGGEVHVLAIVPKPDAARWLEQFGEPR